MGLRLLRGHLWVILYGFRVRNGGGDDGVFGHDKAVEGQV